MPKVWGLDPTNPHPEWGNSTSEGLGHGPDHGTIGRLVSQKPRVCLVSAADTVSADPPNSAIGARPTERDRIGSRARYPALFLLENFGRGCRHVPPAGIWRSYSLADGTRLRHAPNHDNENNDLERGLEVRQVGSGLVLLTPEARGVASAGLPRQALPLIAGFMRQIKGIEETRFGARRVPFGTARHPRLRFQLVSPGGARDCAALGPPRKPVLNGPESPEKGRWR
jgi:hypothetical protein